MAFLANDGIVLKSLSVEKHSIRESALEKNQDPKGPEVVAPVQLLPHGDSIIVVQNRTAFPLLEVHDGGEMKTIRPKLPKGERINSLIPSGGSLFARVGDSDAALIYEREAQAGDLLRRIVIGDDESGHNIACVHEGNFLSFEHDWQHGQALIPLLGTAEAASRNVSANSR